MPTVRAVPGCVNAGCGTEFWAARRPGKQSGCAMLAVGGESCVRSVFDDLGGRDKSKCHLHLQQAVRDGADEVCGPFIFCNALQC